MKGAGAAVVAVEEVRRSVSCVSSVGGIDATPALIDPFFADMEPIA